MDGEPDVSRLAQTVSSRSQGAQRIPVKKERVLGRDPPGEGPTLYPSGLQQGTGDSPKLQRDPSGQASHPQPGTPPPWLSPCVTAMGLAARGLPGGPLSHGQGKTGAWVLPIQEPQGGGGSDAFPMVWAGGEAELGHSPAETGQSSTNRCQAQAGRDLGVGVTAGRPLV